MTPERSAELDRMQDRILDLVLDVERLLGEERDEHGPVGPDEETPPAIESLAALRDMLNDARAEAGTIRC